MSVIFNFFVFLRKLIKNINDPFCQNQTAIDRLDCCLKCSRLNKKGLSRLIGPRCSICGCFVYEKTKYKFEMCPDSPPKWFIEIKQK